jgi:hypothetical protein
LRKEREGKREGETREKT